MPLGKGVRYRVKKTKSGKKVRLAFKGGRVIEAKNIDSGAIHTPKQFAADRKKRKGKKKSAKKLKKFRTHLLKLKSQRSSSK